MPLLCAFFMLSTLYILCNSFNKNVAMVLIVLILQIRKHKLGWVVFHTVSHSKYSSPWCESNWPKFLLRLPNGSLQLRTSWMPLLDTQLQGLLSFVCSWSPRIQGRAWYTVGAQETWVMENIVPSLWFFLLWISISINAHEKALNCIFYIRLNINRNRGFDTDIKPNHLKHFFFLPMIHKTQLTWTSILFKLSPYQCHGNFLFLFFFFFFWGHILVLFNFFFCHGNFQVKCLPPLFMSNRIFLYVYYTCVYACVQ